MNEDRILGKKIIIITAHPDDETFTAAGTIYRNAQQGGSTIVICVTLGEKGKSHLNKKLSEADLAQVRKLELNSVLEFLGVPKKDIYTFDFPDTEVKRFCNPMEKSILPLVRECQPDLIMSFDECGITGHEDHIAIGKVAHDIASTLNLPLATFTLPTELMKEYPELFRKRQKFGKYADTVEFQEPNVIINIDKDVKEKALCLHKSQYGEKKPLADFPEPVAECVLNKEYFSIK